MRLTALFSLFTLSVIPALAQMTVAQKQEDFRQLVALYDKDYSFYEWKRDVIGFDLLKMQPWMDKLAATTDDYGFYEIAQQYVASLKDGHDQYLNPSDFVADLRFRVDIYDGKVLVDAIDRTALPASKFNIQVGDQLVSIDGKSPEEYITDFSKYVSDANSRVLRRDSVTFSSVRPQVYNPRAAVVGDTATVVLQNGDVVKTLTIPWVKSGTLFTNIGPVPNPYSNRNGIPAIGDAAKIKSFDATDADPVVADDDPSLVASNPAQLAYRNLTKRFQYMRKPYSFNGLGAINPVFRRGLPSSFKQRLGTRSSDFFFSGTYTSGNYTIGIIRIPDFEAGGATDYSTLDAAVSQFQREITFLKANTDGLVVDDTRNPGGYGFYALQLLDRLTDKPYTHAGFQMRPQYSDILNLNQLLDQADQYGFEQWQIDLFTAYRNEIRQAYTENRGMTGALPIDFGWSFDPADVSSLSFNHPPILDASGKPVGYNKPVIVLADDSSFSAAEVFSGAFQDAKIGPVVGFPTGGLGGGRYDVSTGIYSEAATSVTVSRLLRAQPTANPDFTAAPYIENIGIRPDVTLDYMTTDNLLNNGSGYVNSFTQALVALLPKK